MLVALRVLPQPAAVPLLHQGRVAAAVPAAVGVHYVQHIKVAAAAELEAAVSADDGQVVCWVYDVQ